MEKKQALRRIPLDLGITLAILLAATLLGLLFARLGFTNSNILLLYPLGVLLIAIATSHRIYSLSAAIAAVFLFNYYFVQPRFTLNAYEAGYPVTFVVMFLTAFVSGTLAIELKRSAREREEAAVLIEKERLRSAILRTISHDLRTPLTTISGNAGNLLENGESFDEATRRQIYADIYEDSLWLIDLVENLLSSTRLENGETLQRSAELAEDILEDAVGHIRRTDSTQQITVVPPEELLLVRVDARLITQVVTNLLNNAILYTPSDAHITLTARRRGRMAEFEVSDDGPGIAPEDREHLFDQFYTGKGKRADGRRGIGLGLALCRTIVEAHGGEISVSENQPHGAVFRFSLPIEEVADHG